MRILAKITDSKSHWAVYRCQFIGNQGTEEPVMWKKRMEQQNSERGKLQGQNLVTSTNEFQEEKKKRRRVRTFAPKRDLRDTQFQCTPLTWFLVETKEITIGKM